MHVPDRVLCHQRVLLVHVQLGRWGLGSFWLLFGTVERLLGGCKCRYGLCRVRGILTGPCLAVRTTGVDAHFDVNGQCMFHICRILRVSLKRLALLEMNLASCSTRLFAVMMNQT